MFVKSWKYTKNALACLVGLEKAYNLVLRNELWRVLQEYDIDRHLLMAIKLLHRQPEVFVGKQSKSFSVGVSLRQECILSPLSFIISMTWIDKFSQTDYSVTIGRCKIISSIFTEDLGLVGSSEFGL